MVLPSDRQQLSGDTVVTVGLDDRGTAVTISPLS